jgi:phospholipase D1/2
MTDAKSSKLVEASSSAKLTVEIAEEVLNPSSGNSGQGTLNPLDLEYLKDLVKQATPEISIHISNAEANEDFIANKISEKLGNLENEEQKGFAKTLTKLQTKLDNDTQVRESLKPSPIKVSYTTDIDQLDDSLAAFIHPTVALQSPCSPFAINNSIDEVKEKLKSVLDKEKFVAFSWCSWCFESTIHGRVQRNVLRRSRFKCTNCSRQTLKCQSGCGAMARGHNDYDEYLCAKCDGTINEWGETRTSKQGHCSHCLKHTNHHLLNKGLVLQSTYQCDNCQTNTFLCTSCNKDFGQFESNMAVLNELIHFECIKCAEEIEAWPSDDEHLTVQRNLASPDQISPRVAYKAPFESFAQFRKGNKCEPLVDGKEFFEKVYEYIQSAKQCIFISAWWLAPFIYLKRDKFPYEKKDRLDYLLWSKANEGVKVYILLWSNSIFLGLCSDQAADWFEKLNHENIFMMRHPLYTLPNFFWSHHQKFLAVDYKNAIVGGLDLAVGRYDTHEHVLTDLAQLPAKSQEEFCKLATAEEAEAGIANLTISETSVEKVEIEFPIKYGDSQEEESIVSYIGSFFGSEESNQKKKVAQESDYQIWPGADYYQPQSARPDNYQAFKKDVIERNYISRMPWHDISVAIQGEAAYDVCTNFVERWNHHREQFGSDHLPTIELPELNSIFEETDENEEYSCQCLLVRSLSEWSGLQNRTKEASVYGSYIAAINNANHYIYIENQYVVSSTAGGGVENQIIQAVANRVIWAIENKRTFRVFIFFPIPEEQGKPANHMLQLSYQTLFRGGFSLMDQIKYTHPEVDPFDYVGFYFLRNHGKLYRKPAEENQGFFFSESKSVKSNDSKEDLEMVAVTDMVFIHSKLLIVDDNVAIIASNNLNDRSMLGDRDSELGAVIIDKAKVDIQMDGSPFQARKFAFELRMKLWREHLGLVGEKFDNHEWVQKLRDPISSESYNDIFRKVAEENTRIYSTVFPEIPSDKHTKLEEWENFCNQVKEGAVETGSPEDLLDKVQGNLCYHPIKFLSEDSLDWGMMEDMIGNELVS